MEGESLVLGLSVLLDALFLACYLEHYLACSGCREEAGGFREGRKNQSLNKDLE